MLPQFWERLSAVMAGLAAGWRVEVVFVDDGSRDGSLAWIQGLAARDSRVALVALSRNFGKEVALSAGLDHAPGDWVAVIDADLQDPPELIPTLLDKAAEGYDVVYARRTHRAGETFLKRFTAAAFYRLMGRLSHRVEIPADTGDFRVLSQRAVAALRQFRERHRFMKGLFAWIGFPSAAVNYVRDPRGAGKTHFSFWRLWNFALDGITSFSTAPLKLASYFGFFVAIAAFIFGAWIIVKTMVYGESVPGYPSLMVTVLFFSGVQLLFIGVLGEYLARMFDETKQRPLYFIRQHLPSALDADSPSDGPSRSG